jgi:predicted nucleic acid-binding protein
MRIIDTSAWIEWFDNSPVGQAVRDEMPALDAIVVPTIVQLELSAWLTRTVSIEQADRVIALTNECVVAPLTTHLALDAADARKKYRLATADAIIYATALAHEAELVTCDAHFKDLPGVIYLAKTET